MNVLETAKEKIKKLVAALKTQRTVRLVAIGLAVVCGLTIVLTLFPKEQQAQTQQAETESVADYTERMEQKVASALSKMRGVGTATVLIRFESTPELVVARVESLSGASSTSSPQILTDAGKQSPLVLKTLYPKALGVIVIAPGAADVAVRLAVVDAVCTLLSIEPSRVNVFAA